MKFGKILVSINQPGSAAILNSIPGLEVIEGLGLTQAARGKPIPTGLAPVRGTKARSLEAFSQYSAFHL